MGSHQVPAELQPLGRPVGLASLIAYFLLASPDPSVLSHVLEGHGDAVWGLAFSPISQRLASCSADGTVRIWDPSSSGPSCLCTFPMSGGEC